MNKICNYIVLFCSLSGVFGSEPRYSSRFEYDEQMLEKMIRMEIDYEKWEKRIDEQVNKMVQTMESLESFVENKVIQVQEETENAIRNYESRFNASLGALRDTDKEQATALPDVLFRARGVVDHTLVVNQTMVFSEVMYNIGDGYDSASGIFRTPVNGTYLFNVHLCQYKGHSIFYAIVANGVTVSSGLSYENSGYVCISGEVVIKLNENDTVYVKSLHDDVQLLRTALSSLYSYGIKAQTFSGVLIR
ncbi:C1QT3-like protein [Mya arenaria]|uniref:C1QT3-like protein n=1 Tax=Mya arenaria TaxID=6604 RepID=A0ABY7EIH4_MYAAR|nr:C1QT3-like protein [Mya arenaria]